MKILRQDMDWHIWDFETNEYLGEIFGNGNKTEIWIKLPAKIPSYIQRQMDFGFMRVMDNGYISMPTQVYNQITEFDK